MPDPRPVGKFGRLPGHVPVGLRDLSYYVAGPLPTPPAEVELPAVADWGMCGNDKFGDCGVAGIDHLFMADAAVTGRTEDFPSDDDVVAYYLSYTQGQDSGVVLADFLAYVRAHDFFGHTVDSYAPVAVQDIPTLHSAVSLYGASYCGITVTASMQQAFAAREPWTMDQLMEPPVGGHCVPVVAYDPDYLIIVTWGGLQKIAYSAWHYIATEAWAVISGELVAANGDGRGVNLDALRADLDRLA